MTMSLRSLLFVPSDDERKIGKALLSGADAVILDLEDSVALPNKDRARRLAAETLDARQHGRIFVRINSFSSALAEADLEAVLFHRPDGTRAAANSGAPSVLVAYGAGAAERLRTCTLPGTYIALGRMGVAA